MPDVPTPSRMTVPAMLANFERRLTAMERQQQRVITDPTGTTGDAAHGHATAVEGQLTPITGLPGYGVAVWNGSAWRLIDGGRAVSALPASPVDGQEVYYLADATNGVVWHLRYRAGSASPYKWEYVGGGSLIDGISQESHVVAVANVSVDFTSPIAVTAALAGDYQVDYTGNRMLNSAGAVAAYASLAATSGTADPAAVSDDGYANIGSQFTAYAFAIRHAYLGVAAGGVFKGQYFHNNNTSTVLWTNCVLRVVPTRVG